MSRRLNTLAGIVWLGLVGIAAPHLAQETDSQVTSNLDAVDLDAVNFDALDLDAVVARALTHNPGFQAELARRAEVDGAVEETAADAWPQVDLVASWNRSRNPSLLNSPDFEDIIEQFPDFVPGEQELWGLAVEVSQPIYSGGKVQAAVDLAELVVDITDAQIASARLDVALDAAEGYYDVLKARRSLKSLEAQEAARRSALKVVQDRYDIGEATRLELLRAQATVAELAPTVAQAEGEVAIREGALRSLLRLDRRTPIQLVDIEVDPESFAWPEHEDMDRLLKSADRNRPELRDLCLQIEALGRQRVVTRAEAKPQVDLNGAYGRQVRLLGDLEDDLFADWRVTVGMKWNLFDGGRVKGQLAQLDSRREQLKWQRDEARRGIALEIESRLINYRTSLARLNAALPATEATREAARVAEESYRLGVALQADWLDAQDRALAQELQLDAAFYDTLAAEARLRRALGAIPSLSPSESPTDDRSYAGPSSSDSNTDCYPNEDVYPQKDTDR